MSAAWPKLLVSLLAVMAAVLLCVAALTQTAPVRYVAAKVEEYSLATRAVEKMRHFDYESAIEDWNRVLEINPNFATAYYNRGRSYEGIDDAQASLADYEQALRLDPKLTDA